MAKTKLTYRTIEPLLDRCDKMGLDKTYAQCVKKVVDSNETLQVTETTVSPSEKFISKGSALVLEDIMGGTIDGPGLRSVKLCTPSDPAKPMGECRVELDFPTEEDVERHGLPPGTTAVLRKCLRKGEDGVLVPISDPAEALEQAKAFCNCVGSGGEAQRKKCARHK